MSSVTLRIIFMAWQQARDISPTNCAARRWGRVFRYSVGPGGNERKHRRHLSYLWSQSDDPPQMFLHLMDCPVFSQWNVVQILHPLSSLMWKLSGRRSLNSIIRFAVDFEHDSQHVLVNTLHFSPSGQAKPSVMKTPPDNWGRDHLMIDHPQQAQLTNLSRHPTGNRQQLSIIQRLTFLPLLIYISSVR